MPPTPRTARPARGSHSHSRWRLSWCGDCIGTLRNADVSPTSGGQMRKFTFLLLLILIPTSLFAQDDDWRRRRAERDRYTPRESAFELTPFVGYRWGGTIFADQTFIFGEDVQVASNPNFGVSFAMPLGDTGMKLELMANRQASELETESGLFEPNDEIAD